MMRIIRQALTTVIAPDTATFARRWPGKVLVAVVLLGVPAALLTRSVVGGTYIDDSWLALAAAGILALLYVGLRRLIPVVLVSSLALGIVALGAAPRLAGEETGDPAAVARLRAAAGPDGLSGYRDLAVALVDRHSDEPVRFGGLGIDDSVQVEVGSLTKAMTGLVIADSVERGELRLHDPVSVHLPELAGVPAGEVTLRELVTHTAGYEAFGPATISRGLWAAPLGRNLISTELSDVIAEARAGALQSRGTYRYSTLGAAVAGLAAAAAAGMSYPELMDERLFGPLGMTHTAVETSVNAVDGGWSASGLPVEPWVFGAYAAGGGVISTASDLAVLTTAILEGSAPGLRSLEPLETAGDDGARVGILWHLTDEPTGRTISWHTGQTGGYSTYVGLDLDRGTAVVVLSDVSTTAVADLGRDLLVDFD